MSSTFGWFQYWIYNSNIIWADRNIITNKTYLLVQTYCLYFQERTCLSCTTNIWWDVWSWCLTPLSTIFQLYRGSQFYWWEKPVYPAKTTDLSQVTVKLSQILLYWVHLSISGAWTHNISCDWLWLHR